MIKEYDQWNELKKNVSQNNKVLSFKVREIFWVNVGQNIGYEMDGKGISFLRPVLILRKFSINTFIGIPLTTVKKEDMFHYTFLLNSNSKINYANLSQLKLFDAKRLTTKLGKISTNDFEELKRKLQGLIFE